MLTITLVVGGDDPATRLWRLRTARGERDDAHYAMLAVTTRRQVTNLRVQLRRYELHPEEATPDWYVDSVKRLERRLTEELKDYEGYSSADRMAQARAKGRAKREATGRVPSPDEFPSLPQLFDDFRGKLEPMSRFNLGLNRWRIRDYERRNKNGEFDADIKRLREFDRREVEFLKWLGVTDIEPLPPASPPGK